MDVATYYTHRVITAWIQALGILVAAGRTKEVD
jgi:hypothetical protein